MWSWGEEETGFKKKAFKLSSAHTYTQRIISTTPVGKQPQTDAVYMIILNVNSRNISLLVLNKLQLQLSLFHILTALICTSYTSLPRSMSCLIQLNLFLSKEVHRSELLLLDPVVPCDTSPTNLDNTLTLRSRFRVFG